MKPTSVTAGIIDQQQSQIWSLKTELRKRDTDINRLKEELKAALIRLDTAALMLEKEYPAEASSINQFILYKKAFLEALCKKESQAGQ